MTTASDENRFRLHLSRALIAAAFLTAASAVLSAPASKGAAAAKAQQAKETKTPAKNPGALPKKPAPKATVSPTPALQPTPTEGTARPSEPTLDTSVPPPSLPKATRAKMRACAEEWQKTKLTAKGELPMWRDFAANCLTR